MDTPAVQLKRTNSGRKFSDEQRVSILEQVQRLDMRGWNKSQIARKIGVTQPMVSLYLEKIRVDRVRRAEKNLGELLEVKLDQYRDIRQVAWIEYMRSRHDIEHSEEVEQLVDQFEMSPDGKMVNTGKALELVKKIRGSKGRLGSAEYLRIITECLEKEAELEGLIDRGPSEGTTVNLNWNNPELTMKPIVQDPLEVKIKELPPAQPRPEVNGEQVMDALFEPKTNGDGH